MLESAQSPYSLTWTLLGGHSAHRVSPLDEFANPSLSCECGVRGILSLLDYTLCPDDQIEVAVIVNIPQLANVAALVFSQGEDTCQSSRPRLDRAFTASLGTQGCH